MLLERFPEATGWAVIQNVPMEHFENIGILRISYHFDRLQP
jgi:hypothetical protein